MSEKWLRIYKPSIESRNVSSWRSINEFNLSFLLIHVFDVCAAFWNAFNSKSQAGDEL